ncbi:hypothetical protein F4804DRAFT_350928 [Jackrogersella minutella]|nr:hypothetical protein F4804DRAFT_350928 [Jackrogersella minutella]
MSKQYSRGPHPLSIFSLLPINNHARKVLEDPINAQAHLVSTHSNGIDHLDIGHFNSISGYTNLANPGRGMDSDIHMNSKYISVSQCSFEIDPQSKVITLWDRSREETTRVTGTDATKFDPSPNRRVIVEPDSDIMITMGSEESMRVRFWFM